MRFRIRSLLAAACALLTAGCTGLTYLGANVPALLGSYQRSANLAYGEDPRQRLDVYSPRNARDRPVVIFWHGGSWTGGRRGLYRFVGAALAQRGFVAVLPDYRLYPQVRFPSFLEDGAQAVAWVQRHAGEFGGDPRHIVLMGHSAGAHEAAFLAYNRKQLLEAGAQPQWIVGLIGLSGPYALAPTSQPLTTIFSSPYTEADWQPTRFVTELSPPTLLVHGTDDTVVAISHSEKLRDVLRTHHVRVETEFYAGKGHADTVAALSVPARHRLPVLDRIVRFVESVSGAGAMPDGSHP